MTKSEKAAALRAEADRIEAEALKAERMTDAARIPTCPECGGRNFLISAYTIVGQSVRFPEEPDEDTTADDYEWGDDYESGDHTNQNESATCNDCQADVQGMLESHGWIFYDEPRPRKADTSS